MQASCSKEGEAAIVQGGCSKEGEAGAQGCSLKAEDKRGFSTCCLFITCLFPLLGEQAARVNCLETLTIEGLALIKNLPQ